MPTVCQGLYILQVGPWLREVQCLARVAELGDHLLSEPFEVGIPVTPILQKRRLRHRKANWF